MVDQAQTDIARDVGLPGTATDDEVIGVGEATSEVDAARPTRRQGDRACAEARVVIGRYDASRNRQAAREGIDTVQVEGVAADLAQEAGAGDHARQGQVRAIGVHDRRRTEQGIATNRGGEVRGNQGATGHDEVTGEREARGAVQEERRPSINRDGGVVRIRGRLE